MGEVSRLVLTVALVGDVAAVKQEALALVDSLAAQHSEVDASLTFNIETGNPQRIHLNHELAQLKAAAEAAALAGESAVDIGASAEAIAELEDLGKGSTLSTEAEAEETADAATPTIPSPTEPAGAAAGEADAAPVEAAAPTVPA